MEVVSVTVEREKLKFAEEEVFLCDWLDARHTAYMNIFLLLQDSI